MVGEQLVMVVHPEPGQRDRRRRCERTWRSAISSCCNYKRISGYVVWDQDFPRTASLKIKRGVLAEQIRAATGSRRRACRCERRASSPSSIPPRAAAAAGKLAAAALDELRAAGVELEVRETHGPAKPRARARGLRAQATGNFLAVGGDGTAFEIVNGLFPEACRGERPTLGFLPLGTGNSFLRDFTDGAAARMRQAIVARNAAPPAT